MNNEPSRVFKYDFPNIPILGSLLLLLIWLNDERLIWFLLDDKGKPIVSIIATTVIFLGTAGLFISQLISFVLFDNYFNLHHKLKKHPNKKFNKTSAEWFKHVAAELSPKYRKSDRLGDHNTVHRSDLKHLTQGQIHAVLHSLEINLRKRNPELASQMEHFYSIYITFSILSLASAAFAAVFFANIALDIANQHIIIDIVISREKAIFNILLALTCIIGAIKARRFKELLRLKLLNSSRLEAIELISKWYQVELKTLNEKTIAKS